jgi:alpha-galactosidase
MDLSSLFEDAGNLPFSFEYHGKKSSELLPAWVKTEWSECDYKGRLVNTINYTDDASGIVVTCEYIAYKEYPAIDWVVYFRNNGTNDTPIIENIKALDINILTQGNVILHHSHGSSSTITDFLPIEDIMAPNDDIAISPNYGRSSDGSLPFFNLEWEGEGLTGAIGWTGQWMLNVKRDEANKVSMAAGQQFTHMKLHPKEMIRTPRILLINWLGSDRISGHNLMRRIILDYYTPEIDGRHVVPQINMNTWFTYDTGNAVNESNQIETIKEMAKIGVENYWLDAGWFEGGWPDGAGNWVPRSDGFPNGLQPLGDAAASRNMGFVLWFEPERVTPNSRVAKEHPEWVHHIKSGDTAPCGQDLTQNMLFNLGIPEAREWLTDVLADCMIEAGVTIYRQDFNIFGALRFWEDADAPDRVGAAENHHIQGLYKMWDELRERIPNLAIDNCASGGRRIDLEMISRSYPLWQSDTQCCGSAVQIQDQVQNAGLNLYVPLHAAGVWDFDPYTWRSVATTGTTLCMDICDKKFSKKDMRKMISETKMLREYHLGDYYPLTDICSDEDVWMAWQFDIPEEGKGMAVFFRRSESRYSAYQPKLRNIDPKSTYIVKRLDDDKEKKMKGKDLLKINIEIDEMPGSRIILYNKAR